MFAKCVFVDVLSYSTAVHLETKTQEGNMTPHKISHRELPRRDEDTTTDTTHTSWNTTTLLSGGNRSFLVRMFTKLAHWAESSVLKVVDIQYVSVLLKF